MTALWKKEVVCRARKLHFRGVEIKQLVVVVMVQLCGLIVHAQEDTVWLEKGKVRWHQSAQPPMKLSVETAWNDLLSEGVYRCPLADFKADEQGVMTFRVDDDGVLDGRLVMSYEREDVELVITLENGYYHGDVTGTKRGAPVHRAVFEQGELVQETAYSPQGVAIFQENKKDFSWVQRDTTGALVARQYVLQQHDTLLVVKENYRAGRLVEKHTMAQKATSPTKQSEYVYTEMARYDEQGNLERLTIDRPEDAPAGTPYHEVKLFNTDGILVREERTYSGEQGGRVVKRRLVDGEWMEEVDDNRPDAVSMDAVINGND